MSQETYICPGCEGEACSPARCTWAGTKGGLVGRLREEIAALQGNNELLEDERDSLLEELRLCGDYWRGRLQRELNLWLEVTAELRKAREENGELRADVAIMREALTYIAEKGLGIDEVHIVVKAKDALDRTKG